MVIFTLAYFIHVFKKFNTSFVLHQLQFYSVDKKGEGYKHTYVFLHFYMQFMPKAPTLHKKGETVALQFYCISEELNSLKIPMYSASKSNAMVMYG